MVKKDKLPKEIEFKYRLKFNDLANFVALGDKLNAKKFIAMGWDFFYDNNVAPNQFYRHRVGIDTNQLTLKRKVQLNNYIRVEHNIDLASNVSADNIATYLNDIGFHYNTSIYKWALGYKTEDYTLVYYVVSEEGTAYPKTVFIEIELTEGKDWGSDKEAMKKLQSLEKKFKVLGIGPKNRVKESLYELYKK